MLKLIRCGAVDVAELSALALVIAWRKLPAPLSLVFVTVNVVACADGENNTALTPNATTKNATNFMYLNLIRLVLLVYTTTSLSTIEITSCNETIFLKKIARKGDDLDFYSDLVPIYNEARTYFQENA